MTMKVFLGIDGGATHARAALMGEGGEHWPEIAGGPLNFYAHTDADVRAHLRALLEEVRTVLPEDAHLSGTVIGSAAVLERATCEEAERLCQGILDTDRVLVVSDCLTALSGAGAGDPGILAIGGTGSVVAGLGVDGVFHRVGGWGHVFGDEGSAYWMATEALRAAARSVDLREDPPLARAICQWLEVAHFADIIPRIYDPAMNKTKIAGLALYLAEHLPEHGMVRRLFSRSGRMLACQVKQVLALGAFPGSETPLYMMGGLLEKNDVVRESFLEDLKDSGVVAREPAHPAHVGAALWAREHWGKET